MKGMFSSAINLAVYIIALFFIVSCEKEQPKKDLTHVSVKLYAGFIENPQCHLLDSLGQKITLEGFDPAKGVSIELNASNNWLFVSCTSLDNSDQPLVLHGGQQIIPKSKSVKIAVNPLTEVAYRLATHDRINMDKYLSDIFSLISVQVTDPLNLYPVYDASLSEISDVQMAMMELIKSKTIKTDSPPETKQILLKNTISQIETAAKEQKSLKEAFDKQSIETFISTHKLTQELEEFFRGNLLEKIPQALLYFVSPEIIRTLESQEYFQIAEGGSGEGNIQYASSDETIAVIDSLGKVTFKSLGVVTIRAIKEGDSDYKPAEAYYTITINRERLPQEDFTFSDSSITVKLSDKTYQQTVTGGMGEGLIYYRSDNNDIAQVDSQGIVTLNKGGVVTISAFKGGDDQYLNVSASYQLSIQGILVKQANGDAEGFSDLHSAVSGANPGAQITLSGDLNMSTPVDFSHSKGTLEAPILISGANNSKVVLSGLKNINEETAVEWTLIQSSTNPECVGRCYYLPLDKPVYSLWVDKKRYQVARWPNQSAEIFNEMDTKNLDKTSNTEHWNANDYWADGSIENNPENTAIWALTHLSRAAMPNVSFTDAEIHIRTSPSQLIKTRINQHEQGSSAIVALADINQSISGNVEYAVSHLNALDSPGEYFYDQNNQQLWVYPDDVVGFKTQEVSVRTDKALLNLTDSSHVKFRYLELFETTVECQRNCSNVEFDQVKTRYPLTDVDQLSQLLGSSEGASYFSASFANPLSNFYQLSSFSVSPSGDQAFILPLTDNVRVAFTPLSHGESFTLSQIKQLRWLTPTNSTDIKLLVGNLVGSLSIACDTNAIALGEVSACSLADDFGAEGDYFWQVEAQLNGQRVLSPVWKFSISE